MKARLKKSSELSLCVGSMVLESHHNISRRWPWKDPWNPVDQPIAGVLAPIVSWWIGSLHNLIHSMCSQLLLRLLSVRLHLFVDASSHIIHISHYVFTTLKYLSRSNYSTSCIHVFVIMSSRIKCLTWRTYDDKHGEECFMPIRKSILRINKSNHL